MSESKQAVEIRNASLDDVPTLMEFLKPFFAKQYILTRTAEEMSTLVRHGFVATCEDSGKERIVGFAAIEIYSQKLGEVQSLAVSPDFQGRGIGKDLVGRCVGRAKAEGVLELMAITATEKLFRDIGFDYSLPNQKRAVFMQTRSLDEDAS